CLLNRVTELPEAAAPFDVAEFEARFPSREQNPIRSKLVPAEQRLDALNAANAAALAPPRRDLAVSYGTGRLGGDRAALALVHGWPKDDARERRMGEIIGAGDWLPAALEAAAAPPGPVDLPGDESLSSLTASRRAAPVGYWLAFYALYRQALGSHAEALDL